MSKSKFIPSKQSLFKGIAKVYFWCGVNVIGLPIIHAHEVAIYKNQSK